ncbi:MAG: hypothetical protein NPIRA05_00340 [Nitrospirales bacterium]|nr:MAG: hypothetical protein NPIRA05_00340 [Nitrospirales bacterium]
MTGVSEENTGQTQSGTKAKSVWIAYLLWFFLGIFAAHRFYLRRNGWLQLFTILLFGIGLLWVLADLFLIPGMVKDNNEGEHGSGGSSSGGGTVLKIIAFIVVGITGLGIAGYLLDPEALEERAASISQPVSESEAFQSDRNEERPQEASKADAEDGKNASSQVDNRRFANLRETVKGRRVSSAILSVSTAPNAGIWVFDEFVGEAAQPGALFVVVAYEYTNISDGPISSFNAPIVKLVSPSGTEYKPDSGATGSEKMAREIEENFLSDLNPMITYRSLEVFEVSEQLYNQPGWVIKVDLDRGEFFVSIQK